MPVQRFAHLGVCVADPDRSMRFYCDLLGFRRVSKLTVSDASSAQLVELEGLHLDSYFLERDGVRLELLHYVAPGHEGSRAPRPMNRLGLTHMALRVEGLEALIEAIEANGFTVMEQTRIANPELGSSVVFVLDPDGVRIELIEMPGDPEAPLGVPWAGGEA